MSAVLLLHGDARQVPLADASVHAIVTSPPYWGLRLYDGVAPSVWGGDPACPHVWGDAWHVPQPHGDDGAHSSTLQDSPAAHATCVRCSAWRGLLGLEALHDCLAWARCEPPCAACYVCHLRQVAQACWRVLRDDGTMWWVLGDTYATGAGCAVQPGGGTQGRAWPGPPQQPNRLPQHRLKPKDLVGIPWRVALALQADGWWLRSAIIWAKPNPMPESVQDRPTRAHEQVMLLTKQRRYCYDGLALAEPATSAGVRPGGGDGYRWAAGPGHAKDGLRTLGQQVVPPWRHSRDVWPVGTTPGTTTHAATMPLALAVRCILAGTSAAGCCPQCGTPWQRRVGRVRTFDGHPATTLPPLRTADRRHPSSATGFGHQRLATHRTTLGWHPRCRCDAGAPMPCTVLDPFVGSGTTLLAARMLGRQAVGVDASWAYLQAIARGRLGLADLARWAGHSRPSALHLDGLPLFAPARRDEEEDAWTSAP